MSADPGPAASVRASNDSAQLSTASWAPATKFIPPSQGSEVVLDEALVRTVQDQIEDHLVTLIVAQGGSGKTTLAAEAAARSQGAVAWLRLAPTDDDPVLLVELLAMAIDRVAPGSCSTVLSLLSAGQVLMPHQLMGVLVNDLIDGDPLIVVLDDLHHLQGAATLDALATFVDVVPEHIHLVATARQLPDIRLARLRANGQLAEIDADDLSISPALAAEILSRRHVEHTRHDEVIELANGWVTGLLLASRLSASDLEAPGSGLVLGDYLAEEVIVEEAPEMRDFLLAISILEDLDPARCALVSDVADAEARLVELRRRLGFLVIDHGGVLRLHDLFRDRLRRDLERSADPETRAALHRKAAAATSGADRVRHLLTAGDFADAANEIELLVQRWSRAPSAARQLVAWIDQLPPEIRVDHPWLDLMVATAAADRLDGETAAPLLRSIIDRSLGDDSFERYCMAQRLLTFVTHDFDASARMAELEGDPRWAELPVTTRVEWTIGSAWPQIFLGRPDAAGESVRKAMSVLTAQPELAAAETMMLNIGAPLAVWPGALGELDRHLHWLTNEFGDGSVLVRIGAELQTKTIDVLRGGAPPPPTFSPAEHEIIEHFPFWAISDDLLRLLPALASGDHRSVDSIVHAALAREGAAGQVALLLSPYVAASARARGHLAVIEDLRRQLEDWRGGPPGHSAVMAARGIIDAERAWAEGDLDLAARGLIETEQEWSATFLAIQLDPTCELALLRAEQGRRREALGLLESGLDRLVERLDAPGRVALCGPAVVPLLDDLAEQNASARRVQQVFQPKGRPNPRPVPGTGEVLTPRELEVLDLLATGASNADIASELYVSVNTVKTHVQRVLTKLQAASRTEAVARARDHRLV